MKLFILLMIMLNCQKKVQIEPSVPNEISVNIQIFPNGTVAYKKENNTISFFTPKGKLVAKTNIKTKQLYVYNHNLFNVFYKLKINEFLYFNPSLYYDFRKFSKGFSGTYCGNFPTNIEYNKLGLITKLIIALPKGENTYNYTYNKYGQLLKIVKDRWVDKTTLENTYNKEGYLVEQEEDEDDFYSKSTFFYDDNNNLIKEIKKIKKNNSKDTFTWKYEYNKADRLIKKYTSDYSKVEKFTYSNNGLLIRKLVYEVKPSTSFPKKEIVQHFTEHNYTYDKNLNFIKEETKYKNYTRRRVVINHEWVNISIEEQKKLAWKNYENKDNSNVIFFMNINIKSYNYLNEKIVSSQDQAIRYTSSSKKNNKIEEYINTKTKYYYNELNQIIKIDIYNSENNIFRSKEYTY